ncbi:deoxyribose-phosphate aldolase-like [Stegodyphus dumicola]|uniref:deoxyribose-phosphate aldolase-like n=1 Tax=Stegodyphus dumicola TaxID=202533 RepID=UPI0015B19324|nr:deoxyribose-phosphate aldolase-like [Stegodyphus dumicola]
MALQDLRISVKQRKSYTKCRICFENDYVEFVIVSKLVLNFHSISVEMNPTGAINNGIDFDVCVKLWSNFKDTTVNMGGVEESVVKLLARRGLSTDCQIVSLLRAVTCLDLTSLSGDDTKESVYQLCTRALNPINKDLLINLGMGTEKLTVGSVCVYPSRVAECAQALASLGHKLPIAAVSGCFPSGQGHMSVKCEEIKSSIAEGATEIDAVICRNSVLHGEWEELYAEICKMKKACGILQILAFLGADFIKTSTGKETVNATLPVGTVMARAIHDYFDETGCQIGFKPAGGIRTAKDVYSWQALMEYELNDEWLTSSLFRIGASGLLDDIEENLFRLATKTCVKNPLVSYVHCPEIYG